MFDCLYVRWVSRGHGVGAYIIPRSIAAASIPSSRPKPCYLLQPSRPLAQYIKRTCRCSTWYLQSDRSIEAGIVRACAKGWRSTKASGRGTGAPGSPRSATLSCTIIIQSPFFCHELTCIIRRCTCTTLTMCVLTGTYACTVCLYDVCVCVCVRAGRRGYGWGRTGRRRTRRGRTTRRRGWWAAQRRAPTSLSAAAAATPAAASPRPCARGWRNAAARGHQRRRNRAPSLARTTTMLLRRRRRWASTTATSTSRRWSRSSRSTAP